MVIPTILEKTWEDIEAKFEIYKNFANTVHIDFIDGKFAPEQTFLDPEPFSKYSTYFKLEAHLMTDEPSFYLQKLSDAGFKTFLGHVERMNDQVEFVTKGQELGLVGLALDLETPVEAIKIPLEDLDRVLLMSVKAGASGQAFDVGVLPKIKNLVDRSFTNIEVDGGIDDKTLPQVKGVGANMFCVNSFLFKGEPEKQFRQLQALI